jgi:hypothetical protein
MALNMAWSVVFKTIRSMVHVEHGSDSIRHTSQLGNRSLIGFYHINNKYKYMNHII